MVFERWSIKIIIVLLTVIIFFTGCHAESNSVPVAGSVSSTQEKHNETYTNTLSLITSRSGLYNHAYAGNENGCYFTVMNEDGSANIMYIDYKSLNVVYLSSDIQSAHNTDGDNSWIENAIGGCTVVLLNNKLGVITFGMPSKNTTSNENAARIIIADLDGANRELLYEFLPNEEIKSAMVFDGEHIYFLTRKYDSTVTNELVSLNTKSKELKTILSYPDDADYSIVGVDKRKIICKSVGIPAKYSNLPINELSNYIYTKLFSIDIDNGSEEKLFEWNGNLFSEIVSKKIYLYNYLDNTISCKNFDQSKDFNAQFSVSNLNKELDFALVGEIIDERFFLLDKNDNSLMVINPTAKQSNSFDFKNGDYNISVIARTATDYLVITGNTKVAIERFAPDGTPYQSNAIYPVYALIVKDDFWNARSNFKKIVYK